MKKYYTYISAIAFSLLPTITFAALVTCGNPGQPQCDFNQFAILVNNIINWFLGISVSVAAVMFSIAGGRMLMNPENTGEREKAKTMFKNAIIGMLIILFAWTVVHAVIGTLVDPKTGALRFLGK